MSKLISLKIESDLLKKFDTVCEDVPRSAYIRRLIRNEIAATSGSLLQDRTECGMTNNSRVGDACVK